MRLKSLAQLLKIARTEAAARLTRTAKARVDGSEVADDVQFRRREQNALKEIRKKAGGLGPLTLSLLVSALKREHHLLGMQIEEAERMHGEAFDAAIKEQNEIMRIQLACPHPEVTRQHQPMGAAYGNALVLIETCVLCGRKQVRTESGSPPIQGTFT